MCGFINRDAASPGQGARRQFAKPTSPGEQVRIKIFSEQAHKYTLLQQSDRVSSPPLRPAAFLQLNGAGEVMPVSECHPLTAQNSRGSNDAD